MAEASGIRAGRAFSTKSRFAQAGQVGVNDNTRPGPDGIQVRVPGTVTTAPASE